jgi:multicomponent Na+:H+ antiporter subunit D
MYVMGRIWSNVFWGQPEDGEVADRLEPGVTKLPVLMTASTVVVVGLSVALLVFAGPLYDLAERAAADLLNPQGYIDAVLGSHSEAGG